MPKEMMLHPSPAMLEPLEERRFLSVSHHARHAAPAAMPVALTVGRSVDATPLSQNQASPQIAINPTNSQNLVEVSQTPESQQAIPVSYSFNGGATWTKNYI